MVSPSKHQKKKVLERRIKPAPGPSNLSASASGSRKVKSSSKPLANRKFYLDIKNQSSLKKLSDQLTLLGGKLELFLDKEVDYVVTDRENFRLKKRLPADLTPTPSPLPSFCSVSPATTDSPTDGLTIKKSRSRAEAMLERVRQQPQKTTGDVLDNAISWNIPVYSLPKFLAWLEKFNGKVEHPKNTNASNDVSRGLKTLTGCYLKIEANNLRPEFKQFSSWPSLNFSFVSKPKPQVQNVTTPQRKTNHWSVNNTPKNELTSNVPSNRMTRRVRRTKEASSAVGGGHGYCEVCRTHYDQLDSHTVSAQHLKYVTDPNQYSQLDSIIQRNNLGSGNLRKSLRIAKSPPPSSVSSLAGMGGRHSLGGSSANAGGGNLTSATDMITTPVSREVARSLRLREYSVAIGPPVIGSMVNGFGLNVPPKSKSSSPTNKLPSPTQLIPPLLPSPQSVTMNGCTRKSQRSRHTSEASDKEPCDDLSAHTTTDRNLRSRKASSAQTPITPPPPERLPSPPPVEKLSPPALRSGSACDRAVTRSDRCSRRSEDRSSSDKDHRPCSRGQEKEKNSLRLKSPGPNARKALAVVARRNRESSADVESTKWLSPTRSGSEGESQLKNRYCRRRCKESPKNHNERRSLKTRTTKMDICDKEEGQSDDDDVEELSRPNDRLSPTVINDDESKNEYKEKSSKKLRTVEDHGRKSNRKSSNKQSLPDNRVANRKTRVDVDDEEDDDGEDHEGEEEELSSRVAGEVPSEDWTATHNRVRSLRHKERSHFYGELESEDSPPSFTTSQNSGLPKGVHKKKKLISKPRVAKKRLSVEEKLIEDNKSYYKVEVLNSKLRSTEYFVNQKQAEERVNGDIDEMKPVVVRFKKIRTTELALLSDEAESFMFGEPKREVDSDEEDDEQDPDDDADSEPRTKSSDRLGNSSIKLETDSSQHSDLIAVKPRSSCNISSPLKIRIKQEPVESDDEDINIDPLTLRFMFEKPPINEPWVEAYKRQQEGTEHYIPMSHDYPNIILPYQIKKRRRKSSKKLETMTSPIKSASGSSSLAIGYASAPPSSPLQKKGRISRLIQASIDDDKPRKSPRCHASTLAIMSSLMKRRPVRECTEKLISYEEESSLPETIESSGSNSNSQDVMKAGPACESSSALNITLQLGDFEFTPWGDKIAEALVTGTSHLEDYEPGSCLGVDAACIDNDAPIDNSPGLKISLQEMLRTSSSRVHLPFEEICAQSKTFRSIRNQNESCASSDCSDFLGYADDDHPSTKKRKKRRNLTGWPVEKPRRKFKDTSGSCLLMNNRASDTPEPPVTPPPATLLTPRIPSSGRGRGRGRGASSSRVRRPCVSALGTPSPLARTFNDDHATGMVQSSVDVSCLPPKKKLSRLSASRTLNKT